MFLIELLSAHQEDQDMAQQDDFLFLHRICTLATPHTLSRT
jgi:hypothetical protein